MAYDRFMIAPINSGLQNNMPPFLLPEDAFSEMNNAYVWRGRIRKRFGSILMGNGATDTVSAPLNSRLRYSVGSTDGAGNALLDLHIVIPGSTFAIGQQFSVGSQIFTITALGSNVLLNTGAGTGIFDTTSGGLQFIGVTASMTIYWYPARPVMGLTLYNKGPITNQPAYAFDTTYAYVFSGGAWQQSTDTPTWHGNDHQFFWAANYNQLVSDPTAPTVGDNNPVMFVTNFNATVGINPPATDDPIYAFNDLWSPQWQAFYAYFQPNGGAPQTGPYVITSRIIVPFKNRLLLLNTIENSGDPYATSTNTAFPQRCRFSAVASPFAVNAWYEPNQQDSAGNFAIGGSYVDAATEEQIVACEFIKDQLIVYFERSTWTISYTGNQEQPFVWLKLNTELGSVSTFSTVPFDKEVLAIDNVGVIRCNGSNVARIDDKIPDNIFEVRIADSGRERIAGIRDYFAEMTYWTFPDNQSDWAFPNRILVYNYKNASWSFNNETITTWGYFEQQDGITWATAKQTWQQANFSWNSGVNDAEFRQIIAGNQQGFVYIIDTTISVNAPVMSITNMVISGGVITITSINHNLSADPDPTIGDFIRIVTPGGITQTTTSPTLSADVYKVISIIDVDTFQVGLRIDQTVTGTYTGGGTIQRISNVDIVSKQWNPYNQPGQTSGYGMYLAFMDFAIVKTQSGELTIDYFASDGVTEMREEQEALQYKLGNNILETKPYAAVPFEAFQNRLWHQVYFQSTGDCIQIELYMSDLQMYSYPISSSNIEIQAITLYTNTTNTRLT